MHLLNAGLYLITFSYREAIDNEYPRVGKKPGAPSQISVGAEDNLLAPIPINYT